MDAQLMLLQEIKSAIWVLIYIVGAGVFLNLIRAIAASYKTIKSALSDTFYTRASSMLNIGNYEALNKYCLEHLVKNPKDAYAYWFLGQASYETKDYDKAVDYFNKTVEIFPSWKKDWVEPYMESIDEQLGRNGATRIATASVGRKPIGVPTDGF
jgi:tetratricopeptide (TPR) repeat protein